MNKKIFKYVSIMILILTFAILTYANDTTTNNRTTVEKSKKKKKNDTSSKEYSHSHYENYGQYPNKAKTFYKKSLSVKPAVGKNYILTQRNQIYKLINEKRVKHGSSKLKIAKKLNHLAQLHAEDMVKRGYFSHSTPEGLNPFDRLDKSGINYGSSAENIGDNFSPVKVVKMWMNSKGHRKNMLNSDYKTCGIGVYRKNKTNIYYVLILVDSSHKDHKLLVKPHHNDYKKYTHSTKMPEPLPKQIYEKYPLKLKEYYSGTYSGKDYITTQRAQIYKLINGQRTQHGSSKIKIMVELNRVAQSHVEDMVKRNYFSHSTPEGSTPFTRLDKAGISYGASAENIGDNFSPVKVVKMWMNSKGHRKNILNGKYKKCGIGVYRKNKTNIYYVLVLTD